MKNPFKSNEYLEGQARKLGHIFRVTGAPGMPEMVCVLNPLDVETTYRVGDTDYPQRFPFNEWKEARKELNKPRGMFLEYVLV